MINPTELAYSTFLMCPPFGFSQDEQQTHRAIRQWLDVYNFISNMALVYLLPAHEELPDQTFAANMGIVLPHVNPHPVCISNFRIEERRGETIIGSDFLSQMAFGPVAVAPAYFEGEADLKYLRDNIYFMLQGETTNANALHWFQDTFNMSIVPIQSTDPNFLHLESILFPLTTSRVIVNTGAISPQDLKQIERVAEVLPLHPTTRSGTSLLRVHRLLIGSSDISRLKTGDERYQAEREKVDQIGKIAADNYFEPVFLNLSEFGDRGGSLSSLIMHINHIDYMPGRT